MIEIRAIKYERELGSDKRTMELTDENTRILSYVVLEIIIKSNPLIITYNCFEEVTMDYCKKNIWDKVYDDIKTHLYESSKFNLDGYVTFRTRVYSGMIDNFLNCILKKIAAKDKHDKLIEELRNYVIHNKPIQELIYLDNTKGYYEIFDESHNLLTSEAIYTYAGEYGLDNELMGTDIVLNYLLKTLPKKIFIRLKNETPNTFIKTLNLVFGDRISELDRH